MTEKEKERGISARRQPSSHEEVFSPVAGGRQIIHAYSTARIGAVDKAAVADIDAGMQAVRGVLGTEDENISRLETVDGNFRTGSGLACGDAGNLDSVLSE